jgi:hypothetical protein
LPREEQVPSEIRALGVCGGDLGWRLDVCLRRLFAHLPDEARAVVEGDAISIPDPLWSWLHGEGPVSL